MLFLVFLELQFTKLIGNIDTKAPVRYVIEGMHRKVLTIDGGFLSDAGGKGIGRGKGDAALLIPDLFTEGKVIGSEGGIPALDLIPRRIEIAKEFQHKGFAQLVGGIQIYPVIEAGDIAAAQAAGGNIPVEDGEVAAEIELGTKRHGTINIQPVIIFRAHVHRHADGCIEVHGIAEGVHGIIGDKRLDIVDLVVPEQDRVEGAAFLERF